MGGETGCQSMAYAQWEQDYLAAAGPEQREKARVWNLEHETRVTKQRGSFKRLLGKQHAKNRSAGQPPKEAANNAMVHAISTLESVSSKWLGLLPVTGDRSAIPPSAETYLSGFTVERFHSRTGFDRKHPPRTVRISPLKVRFAGGRGIVENRFIWVTFRAGGSALPQDDPTTVTRELGLTHFKPGDYVYRFSLSIVVDQDCYVPTCFDASLYEAWKPPPKRHNQPWGLTRDLTSGASMWPELLVQTADYETVHPTGELVSPKGSPPQTIGHVHVDFMIGR